MIDLQFTPYLIWQEVSPHKRPDLQEINTSLSQRALLMSALHVNSITGSQDTNKTNTQSFSEKKLFLSKTVHEKYNSMVLVMCHILLVKPFGCFDQV